MATKKRTTKKKPTARRSRRQSNSAPTSWTSGTTDLSAMSDHDRRAMLGYHANEHELAQLRRLIAAAESFDAALSTARFAAPASIDWRNNNGNWISPVKNQLNCGSCVSFATIGTIEARLKIACGDSSRADDFSEAHLFFCGCGQCCGTGWNFAPALDFAQNTGLAPDAAWPYQPNNQPCNSAINPTFKIDGWKRALSTAETRSAAWNV